MKCNALKSDNPTGYILLNYYIPFFPVGFTYALLSLIMHLAITTTVISPYRIILVAKGGSQVHRLFPIAILLLQMYNHANGTYIIAPGYGVEKRTGLLVACPFRLC